MPVALDVPWDEIKDKYVSGMSLPDISRLFSVKPSTIDKRARRHNWDKPHMRVVKEVTEKTITALVRERVNQAEPAISAAVKEWTAKAHQVAGMLVDKVSERVVSVQDPEDLQRLAGTLERADTVGRRALGLDKDAPSGPAVVNIAIGLAYRPSATSGGLVMDYAQHADAQVVDVEPASEPGN